MSSENIEIKVEDKVAPSISTKLRNIAKDARDADKAVKNLQQQLAAINVGGLSQLIQASANANRSLQASALTAQRVATEQQRTAAAAQRLATEQQKTAEAAQRLATEQQRTATATAQATAAQTRAATAATQNTTAQQNLATATQRTATEQQRTATASQRLATEQQRTAVQTANAAAANDRAALAALRLQQAQDRAANSTRNATSAIRGYVAAAAGILGVTISANAILQLADAYTVLQNKLQNVTETQEQVGKLTNELFDLANRTRTGVEETATAFTRFDRALKFLGKSQEETLRMTETINKALLMSGATTQEAQSALLQLSQGFNAGKLQGDEFRAVAENMPIALDAVAKALGVPINKVKELSSEGKITSEVLFNAFKLIEEQVDKTFAKTTPTISQALTVFRNNAIQTFGEIDKAVGFTAGLSRAIIFLGENLKGILVVLTGLSAALLVAFGGPLLAAIAAATKAVIGFTMAIAANPIGLLVVALSTAIAYFTLFRDEINLGIDDVTTLGDFFRATFEGIKNVISDVKTVLGQVWADMTDGAFSALGEVSSAVGESVSAWMEDYTAFFETDRKGWAAALENTAKVLDAIAGLLTGAATFAGRAMAEIVITVQNAIANAYNAVAGWIESVTNMAINAANRLRSMVGKAGMELVSFERMGQAGATEFEGFGKLWAQSLEDGFKSQGGAMQGIVNGLFNRAQQIGKQRTAASAGVQLRGSGKNQLVEEADKNNKAAKAAENRARSLEKVNLQLDNELQRMFLLKPEREAQAKFDQIEEQFLQKKIKLTESEASAIKAKIKAVQDATEIQRQFDAIYEEATGPLKEYTATQEAANKLLSMGAISQEQHARAITKASEAYANSQDPMREYNKDLQQQFDLLAMLPKQREVEQQIMQVQNDLLSKGIVLNEQELTQLREKLILLQQLNAVSQQEASLMSASVGQRQGFIDQLTAINNLLRNPDSGFTKSDAMTAIGGSDVGQFLVGSPEMMQAEVERLGEAYSQIDALRQADLISEQTAAAAKMQIWNAQQNAQLQTAKTFFGNLEGLQSSNNKKLAAIGKAAAITNAVINTYQSATAAYAAMASIPYVGPALGAAAAAAAIAAGMANVAQIRSQQTGFKQGGWTGSMGVNEVAGVVHGQEFVMDAQTTSRIGVANLEALRNGAATVQSVNEAPAPAPSAAGSDSASGNVGNTTNLRIINSLDPNLVGEYLGTPEGEQVFVNAIRKNADSVRQAISNG